MFQLCVDSFNNIKFIFPTSKIPIEMQSKHENIIY